MEKEHLHLLIHEEIYRIGGDEDASFAEQDSNIEEVASRTVETPTQAAEPETQSLAEPEKKPAPEETPTQESPEIPTKKVEKSTEIPLAIFHSSTNADEMALLQKIIDACKVPTDDYTIFENGFDQSVKFRKALVFVPEAKAFYSPIPYKNSHFLCSKPLADLMNDQQEKGKLWVALQQFVLEYVLLE